MNMWAIFVMLKAVYDRFVMQSCRFCRHAMVYVSDAEFRWSIRLATRCRNFLSYFLSISGKLIKSEHQYKVYRINAA